MNSNYRLGLYEKAMPASLSWHEKLAVAKDSGFDYLEISIDETEEKLSRLFWTKEKSLGLRDAIEDTGVPVGSMCLSAHRKYPLGSLDKSKRVRSLEIMDRALTLAGEFGVRIIQLAGYDVYYEHENEETQEFFAENLQKAVDMASRCGVLLGFETMETTFMDTVEKAMHYVNMIGSPYLGVYPDIGNLQNAAVKYGKPAPDDIINGKGHIFAAHLKETLPNRYREVPFSTGHTDYVGCITQLKKQDVKRYVGEFWYKGSSSWKDDLKYASDFLHGKLDKVWDCT